MVIDNKNHNYDNGGGGEEWKDTGRAAIKPNRVLLKPLQQLGK